MAFSVGERELRVAPLHREAEKIRAPAPLGVDGFVFRDGARDGGVLGRGAELVELRGFDARQVPLFIEQGERIKVDTRTGDFISRA